MDDGDEITEPGGNAGFRIPRIDEGSSLPFGNESSGALEAIELALDGFEGDFKIPGRSPTVGLAVVKGMEKHRLGGASSEKILKCRTEHEPNIGSNDPEYKAKRKKEPDWKQCTEEELWRYVAWHLEGAGIRTVLVGGAVVAIHTEGLYCSGDLDIIADDFDRERLAVVLADIGFVPGKSRYFKHPECGHLFLEFPRGPVEIGDECPVTPDEIEVEGRTILGCRSLAMGRCRAL